MLIISDIHGCYWTLRRLLAKCPQEQVVFAGDMVDRGPHSAAVVRYAMEQGIPTVAGNHEDLMIEALSAKGSFSMMEWITNGGDDTLRSFNGAIDTTVLAWLRALPLYLRFDNLLVSHTGHGLDSERLTALWRREIDFPSDGLYRVFGHTPQDDAVVTDMFACIDTGAAYQSFGYGKMTAFQWPQRAVFEQDYDERPLP